MEKMTSGKMGTGGTAGGTGVSWEVRWEVRMFGGRYRGMMGGTVGGKDFRWEVRREVRRLYSGPARDHGSCGSWVAEYPAHRALYAGYL